MLKVAVVVLIVMLAYGGIYSLMNIIVPKVIMKSSFKAVAGEALDTVKDANYLKALLGSYRGMGVYALATVIFGFFVLFAAFRKAQKWAWWSFLVVGGIMWLWGLINTIVVVDTVNIILHAIGMVIFLVGLLIPVKAFFAKEAKPAKEETREAEEA